MKKAKFVTFLEKKRAPSSVHVSKLYLCAHVARVANWNWKLAAGKWTRKDHEKWHNLQGKWYFRAFKLFSSCYTFIISFFFHEKLHQKFRMLSYTKSLWIFMSIVLFSAKVIWTKWNKILNWIWLEWNYIETRWTLIVIFWIFYFTILHLKI